LDDLLEAILLVSDNMEILANPHGKVIGTVIEAQLDKSKGTLAPYCSEWNPAGRRYRLGRNTYGKLRAMFDYRGHKIKSAGPSTPVQVLVWVMFLLQAKCSRSSP